MLSEAVTLPDIKILHEYINNIDITELDCWTYIQGVPSRRWSKSGKQTYLSEF